jgi:23S rRNA pseudouridine1911/1915/1917 synthase
MFGRSPTLCFGLMAAAREGRRRLLSSASAPCPELCARLQAASHDDGTLRDILADGAPALLLAGSAADWVSCLEQSTDGFKQKSKAATLANVIISSVDSATATELLAWMEGDSSKVYPDIVSYCCAADAAFTGGDSKAGHVIMDRFAEAGSAAGGAGARAKLPRQRNNRGASFAKRSNKALTVLHEDRHVLAVVKPSGMETYRNSQTPKKEFTLTEAALAHCKLSSVGPNPGVVHRLDKGTSGCVVLAKTNRAHAALVASYFRREPRKQYLALCEGIPAAAEGHIADELERGKLAISTWSDASDELDAAFQAGLKEAGHSLIRVSTATGRKHQVRRHLSGISLPIVWDQVYGASTSTGVKKKKASGRLFLHASTLSIPHPVTSELLAFRADLPEWWAASYPDLSGR